MRCGYELVALQSGRQGGATPYLNANKTASGIMYYSKLIEYS